MRILAFLAVLALALSGCASKTAVSGTQAPAGSLQWGIVDLPDVPTLDPAQASDTTSLSAVSLIFGGLVRLDGRLGVRPDGASRWTISRGGTVYTFTIRPNLRFADGTRVTASDFAAALQRALGPQGSGGSGSFYLGLISRQTIGKPGHQQVVRSVTAVDARTLRITLSRPAAHFLSELAFPVSYVPEPSVQLRYGAAWTDHAAGFGPYVVKDWQHGSFLTLTRNRYYYAGEPRLKTITFRFYGDRGALTAYGNGAIDLASGFQPGQELPSRPAGATSVPALALDYLAFNATRPPFARADARRAFAAVATPELVSRAMGRAAFPARKFLPPALSPSLPLRRPTENPAVYLSHAGYNRASGFPTVTLIMPRDPYVYRLAQALQRAWQHDLGVSVTLRQLNPSNYSTVVNARAFDVALVRWGGDYADPEDFLGRQLGATSANITGWSPPGYVRAVTLADSYAPTDPRRLSLYRSAVRLAEGDVPIFPLDAPAVNALIRPGLSGVSLTPMGMVVGNWATAGFKG